MRVSKKSSRASQVLRLFANPGQRWLVSLPILKRLDRYDTKEDVWIEAVVEDTRTPPPDQAAFRIDFPAWLDTLDCRRRRVALTLATGERPAEVAEQFGVSKARMSQWRSEFRNGWKRFHGEVA
jgi:hypothetical protein